MMNLKRIVYPLFFVVLALALVLPVHAATPQYDRSTKVDLCVVASCASSSITVATGDTIMVYGHCWFAAFLNTPTDSLGNSYTKILTTNDINGVGEDSIWSATSIAGNSISVTISRQSGCNSFSFTVDIYSFVAGFGSTNRNALNINGVSGSDTLTMTISLFSIIYETFSSGNANSACPTISGSSGQSIRDSFSCFQSGNIAATSSALDKFYSSSGSTPSTYAYTSGGSGGNTVLHMTIELLNAGGSPSNLGTLTACYGNCGTPAVTLVNTNSTHSINFNNSITLFYEFQSNLNGFILNETVNVAKTYLNGQQVGLGIYTASCNAGVTPFTSACVGQQRANTISNPNVPKGKFTLIPSPIPVSSGQWVGIAVTAINSGLDLNDTNTIVPLFIQSPGTIPPLLNNGASFSSCTCKMGMWVYITGNTVGIPPPPVSSQGCGADVVCFMTASACGLTPSNCLIGALAFGLIYSFISIILLEAVSAKIGSNMTIPGGIYVLTFMGWMTFWSLIVGAIWFVILEILAVVVIFSAFFGSLASGQFRHSGKGGRDA